MRQHILSLQVYTQILVPDESAGPSASREGNSNSPKIKSGAQQFARHLSHTRTILSLDRDSRHGKHTQAVHECILTVDAHENFVHAMFDKLAFGSNLGRVKRYKAR